MRLAAVSTHTHLADSPCSIQDQPTDTCMLFLYLGKIDDHARAKEVVAGLIGAFVDLTVETKGLDFIDREKAKRHTWERAEESMGNSGRW